MAPPLTLSYPRVPTSSARDHPRLPTPPHPPSVGGRQPNCPARKGRTAAVSLQGTLDTLSLPELCELLAGTNKTGALHVRAEAGQGVLWFTGGKVCAGEAGGQTGPPPPGAGGDLFERLHDVCFELFRYHEGSFEFEADRRPSWPAERSVDVSGLLAETERRMAEWREIIAVIPSTGGRSWPC